MESEESQQIETALTEWCQTQDVDPADVSLRMVRDLGGSGFARIYRIDTAVGEFVAKFALSENGKGEELGQAETLIREAQALTQLALQSHIRIPKVICAPNNHSNLLLTEFIPSGRSTPQFETDFGTRLALMHQECRGEQYGWHADNYLGATEQKNEWNQSWADFWLTQRMLPQVEQAKRCNSELCDTKLISQMDQLADQMQRFLASREQGCCLIHGDLWSGNFWSDRSGLPVMIDPACYYADPVAELGMISLFGGMGQRFHDAYFEIMPVPDHLEETIAIYRFYHLLNHLNLFGDSYLTQVQLATSDLLKRL